MRAQRTIGRYKAAVANVKVAQLAEMRKASQHLRIALLICCMWIWEAVVQAEGCQLTCDLLQVQPVEAFEHLVRCQPAFTKSIE